MVHHRDTILVVLLVFLNPSKVTLLNENYFRRFYAYKCSPVNFVTL